jgi:anti-sigma-K factor RskA
MSRTVSDDTILDEGPDPDIAAAELALGVLDGPARGAALRRVMAEPGFAHEVDRWRNYLAGLFDLWPENAAPAALLPRVERSLDTLRLPSVASSSRYWPAATAVMSALAAALLLVIVLRPPPAPVRVPVGIPVRVPVPVPAPTPAPAPTPVETPEPAPTPVAPTPIASPVMPDALLAAAIAPVKKGAPVTAVYDPGSGALRIAETTLADDRRSAQLWVIGVDGAPHSLGLLRTVGATALYVTAANRARMAAGATLAISLEALGGSSTDVPQGPVVAKGIVSRV